jgi:hypothetical protein
MVPAHAKAAAAGGSGQTVRRGLVLTESHDRHATDRGGHVLASRISKTRQPAATLPDAW